MGITAVLVEFAVSVIRELGYPGVFLLMTLESMVAPVPSEGVMPFAGFLVATGEMDLWLVAGVATLGSLFGSYLSYEIGKRLGRPFVDRWGKWLLLSHRDLDWTDRFFQKYGVWAVFIARFIPVVRHLSSIPAGVARMPILPFMVATGIGAFGWNLFLAWVGLKLGERWDEVGHWLEPFDYAIVGLLVLAGVAYVVIHVRRARRATPAGPDAEQGL